MRRPPKPGEIHDRRGVPIYPGDLLRSDHFRDYRGQMQFLYHTVVLNGEWLEMVPTSHLEPTKIAGGGRCWLSQELANIAEVIYGHGPGDCIDYTDRPRVKVPKPITEGAK